MRKRERERDLATRSSDIVSILTRWAELIEGDHLWRTSGKGQTKVKRDHARVEVFEGRKERFNRVDQHKEEKTRHGREEEREEGICDVSGEDR